MPAANDRVDRGRVGGEHDDSVLFARQHRVDRVGEWWLLGRHRVGCGNLADTVDAMLAGEEDAVVVVAANPAAVDMIIRRWQASTGGNARHMASGRRFPQGCEQSGPGTIDGSDAG